MATLQKFKLLATRCTVITSPSPTRSPATSPAISLRRRKTLRMLLTRGGSGRRIKDSADRPPSTDPPKKINVGNKLKDFLLSSSSPIHDEAVADKVRVSEGGIVLPMTPPAEGGSAAAWRRFERRRPPARPFTATFRQRLMRRPFRPVLVAIPEIE